ncbi:GPCR family 2 secretin-like [Trinorchestia longiramus]|nr:GPCR family 2 secretin-like [Trinorchestia longiramus]
MLVFIVLGLYLYVLVVKTFSVENIKLKVYLVIGWAAGAPIILSWALARYFTLSSTSGSSEGQNFATVGCFLHNESPLNWIVRVPIFAVLATNILFVCRIMWVSGGVCEQAKER